MDMLVKEWYGIKYNIRRGLKRLGIIKNGRSSLGKGYQILSQEKSGKLIAKYIENDKPFAIVRFGASEMSAISDFIAIELGLKKTVGNKARTWICRNAGFFPDDVELIKKYAKLVLDLTPDADVIAYADLHYEDYIIKKYAKPDVKLAVARGIEPYYNESFKWTKNLKEKRVLIIHPFADTIKSQYAKRELLFEDKEILPEFELLTLKAVQSSAFTKTEYKNWFEALDYMYDKAMSMEWDVAIIGCGAYAFPLVVRLKKAGRKAIQMSGATQILFGIKGNRWDNHPIISKLYNEYWVRPSEEERPKGAGIVEGGCYW